MTDTGPRWTPQQKLAIEASGRDVLVTASAGTGKTAVLSQRCVRILTDPSDVTDVRQILVMTFTEAAAEEMRSRIAQNLQERYAVTRDARLKHQLLMVDAADISTIHAFCKRLITEHFYRLGIDPAFRILEPDEQFLVKSDILEKTIEEAWADASLAQGFAELLDGRNIGGGRGDFLNNIVSVSGFLDSLPVRRNFYERAKALTDITFSVSDELAQRQRRIILGKLQECKSQLRHAQFLDRRITSGGHWSDQIEEDFVTPVNLCIELLERGDIEACAEALLNHAAGKFKNRPRGMESETAEVIKAPAKRAMETFKGLRELAVISPDYAEIVSGAASLQTKVMVELVQRFDRSYAEAKSAANCLDFADLEHLALRLLSENADIREKVRRHFKYIFVDEYQDINTLQQEIINKVSSGDNVFVVGDIKQSIYGFRQSRPEIFLGRLADAVDSAEEKGAALRVDLSDNFRSRKGVLDFANAVFGRIMKSSVATIDYDEKARLTAGFEYETPGGGDAENLVEIYILDEDEAQGGEVSSELSQVISASQRQAAFVASRIRRMVGADAGEPEFEIYDRATGKYRGVRYGDIMILMRSPARRASEYVEVLRLAGVPVNSESCAGYFATTEIADCICLLKVLDNPRQDIEFAAVLRSPFFKVGETQLAEIRAGGDRKDRTNSFFDHARKYTTDGGDESLRARLVEVLDRLDRWRRIARREGVANLLQRVFAETDYVSFVSALPNGRQRKANLYKLHDRAIQFEGFAASRTGSLWRFVEYVEKLLDEDQDWAPAAPETSAENAVGIMSIHKSKGLEFPVVFLAETNRKFNNKDSWSDCLVDDAETIGLRIVEPHSKVKLSNLAHQVISEKKLDMTLAEEMRLLYVAVTRARERLVVTSSRTAGQCAGILTNCSVMGDEALADWQIKSAQCHFDWLLYGFGNDGRMLKLFDVESDADDISDDLFSVEMIDRVRLDEISASIITKKHSSLKTPVAHKQGAKPSKEAMELLEKIRRSVNWKYSYADITRITAKQSVSELSHRDDEFARGSFAESLDRRPKVVSGEQATGRGARAVGTATHLVIRHIDLSMPVTGGAIKETIARLVAAEKIPADIASAINGDAIARFFESNLGRVVIDNAAGVLREWPFTIAVDARKLGAESSGESVVVQGIIDMLVRTAEGLVVIDFKTDNITSEQIEHRAASYSGQIRYYADACSAILKTSVVSAWLYFLSPGREVENDLNGSE